MAAKPVSQRARWKNHERAVAKFFGTTRNVHGRGDLGTTRTDVVAEVPEDMLLDGLCAYTHLYIECKYSFGIDSKVHSVMNKATKGTGLDHFKSKYTPLVIWGDYYMYYLEDFWTLFIEIAFENNIFSDLESFVNTYGVAHCHLKVPKYINDYWAQVTTDVENRDKDKIEGAAPFVCIGDSSKNKVILFNVKWLKQS